MKKLLLALAYFTVATAYPTYEAYFGESFTEEDRQIRQTQPLDLDAIHGGIGQSASAAGGGANFAFYACRMNRGSSMPRRGARKPGAPRCG